MPELDSSVKNVVNETLAPMGRSQIREFAEKFAKIPGLIKLTLGEPNFNVPEHVKEAAIESIKENESHYSDQKGFLSLREAVSGYLKKQFDLQSLISNSLNNSYLELKETIVGPTGSFTENLNELFQEY